jgi:hypothetical protein
LVSFDYVITKAINIFYLYITVLRSVENIPCYMEAYAGTPNLRRLFHLRILFKAEVCSNASSDGDENLEEAAEQPGTIERSSLQTKAPNSETVLRSRG